MKNLKTTILLVAFLFAVKSNAMQTVTSGSVAKSKFMTIEGVKIHYLEQGSGDPVLFLHGVPMSSYAWRSVMPIVATKARCIAPDFVGFGKSDKPNITYSFDDQYVYLQRFIESLNLNNITLVMTDIGGILGQRFARENPEKIKGMVFMETPLSDGRTFHTSGGLMQKMMFGMARKDKIGYRMFVRKNMFIKMMPMLVKRKLTTEEKETYAAPFSDENSRIPLFALPNSFPKKGISQEVGDMADYLDKNARWLIRSDHPKLVLTADPGMLINKKVLKWCGSNLSNYSHQKLGKAKHLMEEDLPQEIGNAVLHFVVDLYALR